MDMRTISGVAQGPQGLDALAATAAPAAPTPESTATPSNSLEPAVKVDIGKDAHEARFVRDIDTRAIVFQVVDQTSGDVIDQLPSEAALRHRAYAQTGAQSAGSGNLSRVA
ncbi:flagellar protein FlaG [Methylobacterium sp. J-076]|uniref:flagellar protein FlaG n=1 Tax=Methylobacterium sp. J-076 TaxID=2836655 RepID=UPI001FBA3D06|nr:flagellar protein FlaG [Methylobacterium sp. J-076]MCJ2013696.1 flagellar protein FlaG [Methylobacterium sp. J-076]